MALQGLTVQDGRDLGTGGIGGVGGVGGGIYASNVSLTLTNVTVANNAASGGGGGVYAIQQHHQRDRLDLTGNIASNTSANLSDFSTGGGAILADGGSLTVTGSTLSVTAPFLAARFSLPQRRSRSPARPCRRTRGYTAAVSISGTSLTVTGSTLADNTAGSSLGGGGAIYVFGGQAMVAGSTLSGNTAGHGGGIFAYGGDLTIINATLSGNDAGDGGGLLVHAGATAAVTGSTLSGTWATASTRDHPSRDAQEQHRGREP